jgi:hypothetical protein
LNAPFSRVDPIQHVVAKLVEADAGAQNDTAIPKAQRVLSVRGFVRDMGNCPRGHTGRNAPVARVQSNIYLIVMKINSRRKRCRDLPDLVDVSVLRVRAFLKPGVMLLESISVDRIVKEICEI